MKLFKNILVLALVMAFCLGAVSARAAGMPDDHLGETLPDFTVETIDGETFTLSEALKEKDLVMINLWATWCGPCAMEFPYMEEAYELYSDKMEIIALSVEPDDTPEVLRAYANDHGLTFPIGSDIGVGLGDIFATEGIPTTLIIDRFGVVAFIEVGAQTDTGNFTRLFDAFIGEDYTQTTLLHDIPAPKPNVAPASDEDLAEALNAQDGKFFFHSENNEYAWPMLPVETDGRTAVVSTNGDNHGTYAAVIADVTVAQGEALAFDFATSTESGSDLLTVEIDGLRVKAFGGEHDWTSWILDLPEGEHEIAFRYIKDAYRNVGEDCVWLDEVRVVSGEEADALRAALPVLPVDGDFSLTMNDSDAKQIVFEGDMYDLMTLYFASQSYWIVPGDTAEVRITITADMDPEAACVYTNYDGSQLSIFDCLTEDGTGYVFSSGIDSVDTTGYPWCNVYAVSDPMGEDDGTSPGIMFFADEENVNAFVELFLSETGIQLSWRYVDGSTPATEEAARGESSVSTYVITFVDQTGAPVPGCIVNFCTDETCVPTVADETGTALFQGAPYAYHLQVIKVPAGYEFDTTQEFTADEAGGEMTFTVVKQ